MALGSAAARRYKGSQIEIVGFDELKSTIKELGANHGKSVERALAKRALRAMLKPVTASIKRDAPTLSKTRMTGKGKRRRPARVPIIRKSIGSSFKRNKRRNVHEAKAGLNVAKKTNGQFKQAHLYTLGSRKRRTKAGLNRGRMERNDFVAKARERAQTAAQQAGLFAVKQALPIEVEKVRQRHARKAAAST